MILLLNLINLSKSYADGNKSKQILKGVDLTVESGEMVAIMGRSGAGKSTILHIIAGLEKVDGGEIWFQGSNLTNLNYKQLAQFRKNNIGFILQNYVLIDEKNVFDNVALPLVYSKKTKKEIKTTVFHLLEKLELNEYMYKFPKELSGGQAQRVAIARALINDPTLILADEPTGSLDEETESIILDIFSKINKEGRTLIIVTHDQSVAQKCSRIITLKDGQLV